MLRDTDLKIHQKYRQTERKNEGSKERERKKERPKDKMMKVLSMTKYKKETVTIVRKYIKN